MLNASFQPPMNLRVKAALETWLDQAVNDPHPKPEWQKTTVKARESLARYLNVESTSIVFTRDTTEGLNLFQRSVKWQVGDNIIILDTEHPNHAYGWLALAEQGLEVRQIPAGSQGFADASTFAPYTDDRTVAIGLSSVMFHNGQLNDVKNISAQSRPRGIHVLVDATQQVGVMPIDLKDSNPSAVAFGCHKGLDCPSGLGALYIDPKVLPLLKPTPPIVGAGAIANLPGTLLANADVVYHAAAQRYEHLNLSLVGTTALQASLSFLAGELGMAEIEQHLRSLGQILVQACERAGVEVLGSKIASRRAPQLYVLKLMDERWQKHFQDDKIWVSHYRDGVRVSLGWFNEINDIKVLAQSIEKGMKAGIPLG